MHCGHWTFFQWICLYCHKAFISWKEIVAIALSLQSSKLNICSMMILTAPLKLICEICSLIYHFKISAFTHLRNWHFATIWIFFFFSKKELIKVKILKVFQNPINYHENRISFSKCTRVERVISVYWSSWCRKFLLN